MWIENSYDKHMSLNAQNKILNIMALKVLHGIASGIVESDTPVPRLMRALMQASLNSL